MGRCEDFGKTLKSTVLAAMMSASLRDLNNGSPARILYTNRRLCPTAWLCPLGGVKSSFLFCLAPPWGFVDNADAMNYDRSRG